MIKLDFKINDGSKYILIIGASLIVLTYLVFYTPLFNSFLGVKDYKSSDLKIASLEIKKQNIPVDAPLIKKNIVKKAVKMPLLRDPFNVDFSYEIKIISTESNAEKKPAPKPRTLFTLQGIFKLPEGSVVSLIDDQMLSPGEKIHRWTVSHIGSDHVVLKRGLKIKVLKLRL